MTAAPATDPLAFDFDLGFKAAPERVTEERAERLRNAPALLPYHVGFFDDYLRGIMRHDLVLLGADTGVGKTDLATSIAVANARDGKNVRYFALEAEPSEIERRAKYSLIAQWAFQRDLPFRDRLNYVDWYLGRVEGPIGALDREADDYIARRLSTLHTFYRGRDFGGGDIERLMTLHQTQADLFVLDHLHYVDLDDDKNENASYRRLTKKVRDLVLTCGKPVICVVHLRKAGEARREPQVPPIERVHGSSEISKVSTATLMISRAPFPGSEWWKAPTFFSIPKWRTGGASRHVAMCNYDVRTRSYEDAYILGRLENNGQDWTEIDRDRAPPWAKRMRSSGINLTTVVASSRSRR